MWFLPLSALWCVKGTWDIQFTELKTQRTERFYFVIRFEIPYKEDVDCFKCPDGSEGWGCFLILRQIEGLCEKAVVDAA